MPIKSKTPYIWSMSSSPGHFSPSKAYENINIPESPLGKQGNLTGTPRQVRDLAARFYNYIQDWNKLHIDGINKLSKLVDLKISMMHNQDMKPSEIYPMGLEDLCSGLNIIAEEMMSLLPNIEGILVNFRSLNKLENLRNEKQKPIFFTWPLHTYVQIIEDIVSAYKKEASVKEIVKENIAHMRTTEDLALYFALWVHQPYIESQVEYNLESLLKETGHR